MYIHTEIAELYYKAHDGFSFQIIIVSYYCIILVITNLSIVLYSKNEQWSNAIVYQTFQMKRTQSKEYVYKPLFYILFIQSIIIMKMKTNSRKIHLWNYV